MDHSRTFRSWVIVLAVIGATGSLVLWWTVDQETALQTEELVSQVSNWARGLDPGRPDLDTQLEVMAGNVPGFHVVDCLPVWTKQMTGPRFTG